MNFILFIHYTRIFGKNAKIRVFSKETPKNPGFIEIGISRPFCSVKLTEVFALTPPGIVVRNDFFTSSVEQTIK